MFSRYEKTTKEKAVMILDTLIVSSQLKEGSDALILELTSYRDAIEHEEKKYPSCKLFILMAMLNVQLKAGKEESEELFQELNIKGKNLILQFNAENPDKQQFNTEGGMLCYMPPGVEALNKNA